MMPAAASDESSGEDSGSSRPPASAAATIGIMVGIAVAAVVLVVGGVRIGGRDAEVKPDLAGIETDVPAMLADGRPPPPVPAALERAFDGPVVAAAVVDELPEGFFACDADWGYVWDKKPEFASAMVTPDGVLATFWGTGWEDFGEPVPEPRPVEPEPAISEPDIDPDGDSSQQDAGSESDDEDGADIAPAPAPPAPTPEPTVMGGRQAQDIRVLCDGSRSGGANWEVSTASVDFAPAEFASSHSMGWTCCDEEGRTSVSMSLVAPDGAEWAVQERGAYWLAYPVGADATVRVAWRFRDSGWGGGPGVAHVVYTDGEGTILDETYLRP